MASQCRLLFVRLLSLSVVLFAGVGLALAQSAQDNKIAATQPVFVGGKTIALCPNDIVYCAATGKIYASMPSSDANRGNTITIVSPDTGAILKSIPIGSDPGALVVSDPPKYLYVALGGAKAVRRFDLTSETAGLQFPIGDNLEPESLCAVRGKPDSVIVTRKLSSEIFESVVFDGGVPRPKTAQIGNVCCPSSLPDRYYGFTTNLSINRLENDGLVEERSFDERGQFGSMGIDGTIADVNNSFEDVESDTKFGYIPVGGNGSLFFCAEAQKAMVMDDISHDTTVYSLNTYTPIKKEPFDGPRPNHVIHWGTDGIAWVANSKLFIAHSPYLAPAIFPTDIKLVAGDIPALWLENTDQTYSLTVTNSGNVTATNVVVSDYVGSLFKISEAKSTRGDTLFGDGSIKTLIDKLAPRQSATVTITLFAKKAGDARLTAVVRADQSDPLPRNNISIRLLKILDPSVPGTKLISLKGVRPATDAAPTIPAAIDTGPDLTGHWVTLQQNSVGAGKNLQATLVGSFIVVNIGKAASPQSLLRFILDVHITSKTTVSDSYDTDVITASDEGTQLLQEVTVPPLKPGETFDAELNAPLDQTDDESGEDVIAQVNAGDRFPEVNKANNQVNGIIK